jgi:hypothetical protein
LIYSQDSTKRYFKQTGLYEDVKVPGLLFDVITIQSIQHTISELKAGREGRICRDRNAGQFGSANRKIGKERTRIDGHDTNYTNVWSFLPPVFNDGRWQKQSYLHPTEKPLEIIKRLVEMLTPEGGTVLDPFAGSGTTALACKELNRNYICIEKEREYIDIIHQRLNTPIVERGLTVEEQVEIEKPPYQQLSLF